MKFYYSFFLLIYITAPVFAQQDMPAFGVVTKADLLMNDCDFDKGASAVKLIDYCDIHFEGYDNTFKLFIIRRVRIKILKDKALNYANVKLDYYSKKNYENITDIIGNTYNIDEAGNIEVTPLDQSSIYKKETDKENTELAFAMPHAKVGSIIEYTYTDERGSPKIIDDWYLQDEIPTRLSVFNILIPSMFNFAIQIKAFDDVEQIRSEVPEQTIFSGGTIRYNSAQRRFISRNIMALHNEPFMSSFKDYLQRIMFHLSSVSAGYSSYFKVNSAWEDITKNLLDDDEFGSIVNDKRASIRQLNDSIKKLKDAYSKMVFIYKYIQTMIAWNGNEGISGIPLKQLLIDKSGSNADINLCLVALLKNAGITTYPLLVSSRSNGEVNKSYPFLEQFNDVMAYVLINNQKYILNAADKYNPAWLIPNDVINTEGFIVDNNNGGWVTLTDKNCVYQNIVSIIAAVDAEGMMKGSAKVFNYGYSKNERLEQWATKKEDFSKYFSDASAGVKVKNIVLQNDKNDTLPLIENIDFSMPVTVSGDYLYFPVNMFLGIGANPFIADERWTDVDFGYKKKYDCKATISLPDGYELNELPEDKKIMMPDTSIIITRTITKYNNQIQANISINFLDTMYPAIRYVDFQKIYKKIYVLLGDEVVIKKKK